MVCYVKMSKISENIYLIFNLKEKYFRKNNSIKIDLNKNKNKFFFNK